MRHRYGGIYRRSRKGLQAGYQRPGGKLHRRGPVLRPVLHVRGGNAAVQVGGFAQVGYTGNVPAMGYTKLSADGTGGVKGDTAGTEYLVAAVDTVKKTVTVLL